MGHDMRQVQRGGWIAEVEDVVVARRWRRNGGMKSGACRSRGDCRQCSGGSEDRNAHPA